MRVDVSVLIHHRWWSLISSKSQSIPWNFLIPVNHRFRYDEVLKSIFTEYELRSWLDQAEGVWRQCLHSSAGYALSPSSRSHRMSPFFKNDAKNRSSFALINIWCLREKFRHYVLKSVRCKIETFSHLLWLISLIPHAIRSSFSPSGSF